MTVDPFAVNRIVPGRAGIAEATKQYTAVVNLLATTLPRDVRLVLRQFEQSLSMELDRCSDANASLMKTESVNYES